MDCTTSGFPVFHQFPKFAQLHVRLILCHPLLLTPSIFPSIRFFSKESALCIRWPKYWSFSFNFSPSNEYSGFPLGLTGLISCSPRDSQESSPTPQFKSISPSVLGFLYGTALTSIHVQFSTVQFTCSIMSNSLRPHRLQHHT